MLLMNFKKCRNGTNSDIVWKSEAEIDDVINSQYLNIATLSYYFDFDDYNTPIKSTLSNFDMFTFHTSYSQLVEIEVQQNQVTLTDDYIAATFSESHKYYSSDKPRIKSINIGDSTRILGQLTVSLAKDSHHYERVVYSFFDMFGYLGGLFDFWYFVGYLLTWYLTDKYFKYKLLSSLYHVESSNMSGTTTSFDKKLDVSIAPKTTEERYRSAFAKNK